MSTVPSKHHQPLHNFSLPFLKWGQRIQGNNHCRRRHHHHRSSPLTDTSDSDFNNRRKPHRFPDNTAKREIDGENGVVSLDGGNGNSSGKLIDVDVATAVNGDMKPWNLRPRRFAIDTVDGNGNVVAVASAKLGRSLRGVAGAAVAEDENEEEKNKMMKKKRRLWISLSKEEIEEDIYAFTGSRPSRRPKKRNKIAQKHLDNVFPGLYLVGASADSYRV